ncbi:hypothetical protein C8J56DRAFT_901846 [Mycena floridula]|nr:hypothetical protein C8J56DRAFT_901846 [Mycena floridula]
MKPKLTTCTKEEAAIPKKKLRIPESRQSKQAEVAQTPKKEEKTKEELTRDRDRKIAQNPHQRLRRQCEVEISRPEYEARTRPVNARDQTLVTKSAGSEHKSKRDLNRDRFTKAPNVGTLAVDTALIAHSRRAFPAPADIRVNPIIVGDPEWFVLGQIKTLVLLLSLASHSGITRRTAGRYGVYDGYEGGMGDKDAIRSEDSWVSKGILVWAERSDRGDNIPPAAIDSDDMEDIEDSNQILTNPNQIAQVAIQKEMSGIVDE